MKKQILFLALLLFLAMRGMDEPQKGKLLFTLPEKSQQESLNEWWKVVRKDWLAYHRLGENFPKEVNQRIAYFLRKLKNFPLFSTSEDRFFRKLLGCCITFSYKEKPWALPIRLEVTHDGKYYVEARSDQLRCYNSQTKSYIGSFGDKSFVLMIQRGSQFICRARRESFARNTYKYYLCDIANNWAREIGKWQWTSGAKHFAQYVAGFDNESLYICDIANVDLIVRYKMLCVNRDKSFVEFTCDGYILFGPGDGTIGLWTIENEKLKELARYDSQGLLESGKSKLVHYDGSDYLILGTTASLGIKIEKNDKNTIGLDPVFFLQGRVNSIVGKDTVLVGDYDALSIMDFSGEVVRKGDVIDGHCYSEAGKHIFYDVRAGFFKTDCVIAYVMHDDDGRGINFARKIIEGVRGSFRGFIFNQEGTLFAAHLEKPQGRIGVFDFYGKKLTFFDAEEAAFHQNGRAVLYQKKFDAKSYIEGGLGRKCVLYPKRADEHLKSLAYSPLTLAQYIALEKVYERTEELREENPIRKALIGVSRALDDIVEKIKI
jgi:hypothetical protein